MAGIPHNIYPSKFKRFEYVGHSAKGDPWRVRKTGTGGWEATSLHEIGGKHRYLRARTLAELGAALAAFVEDYPRRSNPARSPARSRRAAADPIAANELFITSDSDRRFSVGSPDGQPKSIRLNLLRKIQKGVYNHRAAVKLYRYLADAAAKAYVKEYGGNAATFTPATRDLVAREMAGQFYRVAKHEGWPDLEPARRKNPVAPGSSKVTRTTWEKALATARAIGYDHGAHGGRGVPNDSNTLIRFINSIRDAKTGKKPDFSRRARLYSAWSRGWKDGYDRVPRKNPVSRSSRPKRRKNPERDLSRERYVVFTRSATGFDTFSRARRMEQARVTGIEEARKIAEWGNARLSAAQKRRGTRYEFQNERDFDRR